MLQLHCVLVMLSFDFNYMQSCKVLLQLPKTVLLAYLQKLKKGQWMEQLN